MTTQDKDRCTTCHSKLATRPVLYTDTVGGEQTRRDDLWAVTTEELNALEQQNAELRKALEEIVSTGVLRDVNKECCGCPLPGWPGDGFMQPPDPPECCGEPTDLEQRVQELIAKVAATPADSQQAQADQSSMRGCLVNEFSSRVCENGTKSCVADHTNADSQQAKDAERLNWLDQNLFNRDLDEWDRRRCKKGTSMWVFFAPTRHGGGAARQRIDEAMAADSSYKPNLISALSSSEGRKA